MKDTGKSSSRKLRRVVEYLLYRMDPQKTHYKISFSAKMSKIKKIVFFYLPPPLTPIALGRGLCMKMSPLRRRRRRLVGLDTSSQCMKWTDML